MAYVEEFSASTTWTCPAGVYFVAAECWGGGGAGGGCSAVVDVGGGGAAGGTYAAKAMIPVTPGNNYTVTVAAQRTGTSAGNGGDGNDTSFVGDGGASCVAKGGPGGIKDNGAGGAGSTTGCVGDLLYAGGSGGTGDATHGAGGGGAAGSQGGGGAGNNTTAGTSASINPIKSTIAGNGANARTTSASGNNGVTHGGGGGGGLNTAGAASARTGGTGMAGYLRLLYATSTPSAGGLIRHPGMSGGCSA